MPLHPNAANLVVRWTIGGNLRDRAFEMLRLSITCAARLFGPEAHLLVCVNNLSLAEARARTGTLPLTPEWHAAAHAELDPVLCPYFDHTLIDGMGWKLVPLRTYPQKYELALDNDCILWDLPAGMRAWLSEGGALFAEDVERYLGSFDTLCPPGPINAGIRGLAPGADLGGSLGAVLRDAERAAGHPLSLIDEIEEQGLQAAAVCRLRPLHWVRNTEVTICSPFWPRNPELGPCGAHFVGMNAAHIPWNYYDRPADAWLDAHWERHRPELYRRAGLPLPEDKV